jgi:hypothetical protein
MDVKVGSDDSSGGNVYVRAAQGRADDVAVC